ncbi:MAG: sel1 repeat family protein [Kiritimatiellae bacterium]|nr:sel1 repeat family protein [Kiritimatiellia bacterium]
MEIKGRNIAGHDDADAQYQLYFDCRDRGENVECIKWLRKAARNGLPDAEYEMGFVYEDGNLVRRSFRKAVEWYRKAAEQGHATAERILGKLSATATKGKHS